MNRWDRQCLLRATAASIAVWLLCVLVVAATDEGGVPWAARVGRALPTAPLAAAVAVGLTLSYARSRGELRALEALGRSETRSARATVVGGVVPAFVLGGLALCAIVDVSSFFPRTGASQVSVRIDDAGFVDDAHGVRISREGELSRTAAQAAAPERRLPDGAHLATGLTVTCAAFAMALASSSRPGRRRRAWLVAAAAAAITSLVCFQLSAASRIPAWLAIVPQLVVLVGWCVPDASGARVGAARWWTKSLPRTAR